MVTQTEPHSNSISKPDLYFAQETPGRQIDLYEALVQAQSDMGHGVAVYDGHSHHFLYVNNALAKIFGYTKEEMFLLPGIITLVHSDVWGTLEKRMAMRIADINVPEYFEAPGMRKDGTPIFIEGSFKRVEGTETKFVGIIRDITERKQAELDLIRCNAELEKAYAGLEEKYKEAIASQALV
jgi:PAS domain S-box-containing protein